MIRQISVFAENAKGTMKHITQVLEDARINMSILITNDSAEYGIIRMLVNDTDRAVEALRAAGYLCRSEQVLAVEISDDVGSLNRLLGVLSDGNINIDYLYVTYSLVSKLPYAILKTQDMWEVEEFLAGRGYRQVQDING